MIHLLRRTYDAPLVLNISELYLQELHRIVGSLTSGVERLLRRGSGHHGPDASQTSVIAAATADSRSMNIKGALLLVNRCPLTLGIGQVKSGLYQPCKPCTHRQEKQGDVLSVGKLRCLWQGEGQSWMCLQVGTAEMQLLAPGACCAYVWRQAPMPGQPAMRKLHLCGHDSTAALPESVPWSEPFDALSIGGHRRDILWPGGLAGAVGVSVRRVRSHAHELIAVMTAANPVAITRPGIIVLTISLQTSHVIIYFLPFWHQYCAWYAYCIYHLSRICHHLLMI